MGKKSIKSSRNVLGLPKESSWPLLQESESEKLLHAELKNAFKLAKTQQPRFNFAEFRKMNKESRAKKVEEFFENLSPEELDFHRKAKHLKKSLALGVNEVSRSLEKKELACCLLHGQAKPKMINAHIVQLAKCRMVPILILNDLKQSLKESISFSSLAVGFLKEVMVDETHAFHQLCLLIINLSKEFSNDSEQTEDPVSETDHNAASSTKTEEKCNDDNFIKMMMTDCKSLHLNRTSTNYRVFHPPDDGSSSDKEDQIPDVKGIMILDLPRGTKSRNDNHLETEIPRKKARYFIEPNILKVQSNPNKFRKKNKSKKKS